MNVETESRSSINGKNGVIGEIFVIEDVTKEVSQFNGRPIFKIAFREGTKAYLSVKKAVMLGRELGTPETDEWVGRQIEITGCVDTQYGKSLSWSAHKLVITDEEAF